jgi:cysteine-rich repeat protein
VKFTAAVCVNAVVYAEFTQDMNEATVADAVQVEACTGNGTNPCSAVSSVAGAVKTHPNSFTFIPSGDLSPSSLYRVTISPEAKSLDGSALAEAVQWTFTTSADTTPCTLKEVRVSPKTAILSAVNDTKGFSALPVSGCVVTDASGYSFDWSVNESYARFNATADLSCVGGVTSCATAEALAEGTTKVTAKEAGSAIEGSGDLSINFTDPYVVNVWPACTEACVNAEVGGSFNTGMDTASVEKSGAIILYECANELCTSLTEVTGARTHCSGSAPATGSDCRDFSFDALTLTAGKYYRVVVSGEVESLSGVALTRANYGGDYSWTFRVREDGTACAVSRISVSPSNVTLQSVGETSAFEASAYGEADSCSVSGERLSGFDYTWNWTDPIADEDIDSDSTTRVAEWYGATLVDSDPLSVPEGCTSSCTSAGSETYKAICGDGILRTGEGEECEDGNVANGDGCSSSCLREGANTYGACGNGTVERDTTGAGEDCDDKNAVDGDGCSSTCLAEGSRSVGATCGNNDIAADIQTNAGEECDDGNATNGDGCSSACVDEGTPTLASIGGAVCGDGKVDAPAETCDDSNVKNGDSCSSSCLFEGASVAYGSVCGDGAIDKGEECEDGNKKNGDGCSSECLLEGSSKGYAAPSFCGDGTVGTGESAVCEVGARADGKIDPLQVAVVRKDAVFEVSTDTKEARATVEVGESSSGFSTTADLTLMCAATKDTDCKDPTLYGVGTGNCCVQRPTVTLSPSSGSTACRNAALYGVFSQKMEMPTFTYSSTVGGSSSKSYRMYAKLDLSSAGSSCPSTHTTLAQLPGNIFARLWESIVRFVTGDIANASAGDCVVPIDSYEQVAQDDGTYKVYLHYGALLQAGGTYSLVVEGDDAVKDATTAGVLSAFGTGMNGTASTTFTAGADVCALDEVSVADTDDTSPNTFTRGDESHTFAASGLSHRGTTIEEIDSIPGEYAWGITSWTSADTTLFTATMDPTNTSSAAVATLGVNGRTNVVATATITEDTYGVSSRDTVDGSTDVTAFLCENPWPPLETFPWSDDAAGGTAGLASEGVGWTNYSLYYCRDSGATGTSDDYPSLSTVRPEVSKTPNVIKEYLYEVGDGSGDAIGIRIVSNSGYLSPLTWYEAQGFTGKPTEVFVDGFKALQDGRTTYVSAPNLTDANSLYPNIYVISVNEGASDSTRNIVSQIIENISFTTNVADVALCVESDGTTTTSTACSSDLDCSSGQTCGSVKAKMRRDIRRLTDLTDLRTSLEDYGKTNGQCSATTSKFCSTSSDCPSGESCLSIVPLLSSGTFVRGLASSVWSSWNDILGGAVESDSLPTDPLNVYASCGTADSTYASYDAQTCVNKASSTYACPADSHAYHYRTNGPLSAFLSADLEYNGADWYSPITDSTDDHTVTLVVGNSSGYAEGFETTSFCDGSVYGSSSSCGDGVVGSSETCEIGQAGGTASACTTDGGITGTKSQICNSTCSGYTENPSASCLTTSCGDGVIDSGSGEICDDGSLNGSYGYCGATCTYDSAFYCGDGELAGGEACDCGSPSATLSSSVLADARAYGADAGTCGGNRNGTYDASPTASCSWDCRAPASYCGDGKVDSGEQCDGTDATWDGKLCYGGTNEGGECSTDADCTGGGSCGGPSASASTTTSFSIYPTSTYLACATGKTRTRTCDDAAGAKCSYTTGWLDAACTDIGSCGDGVVDADEACDDGNTDSSDSCTSSCVANVCGDGAIYVGSEECDEGAKNGGTCSSSYGSSCTACSVSCRKVVASGEFCGDGKINGAEYCDASDIPYTYFDAVTGTTFGNCGTIGATVKSADGSVTYTCQDLGVCNGGAKNGEYCATSKEKCVMLGLCTETSVDAASCGTGSSCVKPTCGETCTASCPFTYSNLALLMTSNQPGARASASVSLNSFSDSATSTLPNAATVTVPPCTAVGAFTGNISLKAVNQPDVYVTFVLDRSGSMGSTLVPSTSSTPAKSRMKVAQEVLSGSVSALYDEFGTRMHVGLVGFSDYAGTGLASNAKLSSCAAPAPITSGGTSYSCSVTTPFDGFMDETDETDVLARIDSYVIDNKTQTDDGLSAAKKLLDDKATDVTNVRKIIILLSDGAPTDDTGKPDSGVTNAAAAATDLKTAGYELYTVALTDVESLKTNMKEWSSNSAAATTDSETSYAYNLDNNIDYAYDGSTAEELTSVYESIVDSIVGVTLSFVTSSGSTTTLSTATLVAGTDLPLPWPSGFACDGVTTQKLPVQITFGGEGQIEFSNVKYSYCAP